MDLAKPTNEELALFQGLIARESGLTFASERLSSLEAALAKRGRACGSASFNEYYHLLCSRPEGRVELKNLLDLLTVGETYFFRNEPQFAALKESVIPDIVRRKFYSDRTINVWSAGCATGEEPYTLAILLMELLPLADNWTISITGSDVNRDFLRRAGEGLYSARSVSRVPPEYFSKYFVKQGDFYRLSEKIKRKVNFAYHNLVKDPYILLSRERFDLIFCRNVTIYFAFETAKEIVEKFFDVLDDDGYLFLGHSETLWNMTARFRAVECPHTFFYRKDLSPDRLEPPHLVVHLPELKVEEPLRPPAEIGGGGRGRSGRGLAAPAPGRGL